MLSQAIVKATLGMQFRAPHDFKLTQVLKMHGITTSVIDFFAFLSFCMSESMREKR